MVVWSDGETMPFLTGWRPARIEWWYDADTPFLQIDLGFGVAYRGYVRLLSENALLTEAKADDIVDAWELRGAEREAGLAAKKRVQQLAPAGSEVRIWSYKGRGKTGKYGRYLVVLLYRDSDGSWLSIGDKLVMEGHAERSL